MSVIFNIYYTSWIVLSPWFRQTHQCKQDGVLVIQLVCHVSLPHRPNAVACLASSWWRQKGEALLTYCLLLWHILLSPLSLSFPPSLSRDSHSVKTCNSWHSVYPQQTTTTTSRKSFFHGAGRQSMYVCFWPHVYIGHRLESPCPDAGQRLQVTYFIFALTVHRIWK